MHSLCACAHKSIYCAHLQVCACWLVGSCVCDDTFRSGNRVFHSFTVHLSTFAICMHRILHDILHHTSNRWENDTPYISFCVRFGDVLATCAAHGRAQSRKQQPSRTIYYTKQYTTNQITQRIKNHKFRFVYVLAAGAAHGRAHRIFHFVYSIYHFMKCTVCCCFPPAI